VIVQARSAGFIEKVYPLTVGDKIRQGTPLVDLTIPDWVEAQSEYLLLRDTGGTATQVEGSSSVCASPACRKRIFAA
jgi:Cu(I)/Ag(I) efflux system membrane fusion protein